MAVAFINNFNELYAFRQQENVTIYECESRINNHLFYQLSLVPAIIIVFSFALTRKRRNILSSVFGGRPGLIFPMDPLTRSSRISYACAFGATSFLVYEIVLKSEYAIPYTGKTPIKSLVVIASMMIYGLSFFPIFACLAIGSVFGFGLGTLYTWMMTAIEIFKLTDCAMTTELRVLFFFRELPGLLCLGYLCLSVPIRMVVAGRKNRFLTWDSDIEADNTLENIRKSYSGHHVTKLFRKVKIEDPPVGRGAKFKASMLNFVNHFFYRWKRGFRYSSRILSVMLVAVTVVYMLTLELITNVPGYLYPFRDLLATLVDIMEDDDSEEYKKGLFYASMALDILEGCIYTLIAGCCLATALTLVNVLHMLSNYRTNLLALYRGDHSHIPAATKSNAGLTVGYIKYAGFQVAYIIWGYMITFGSLVAIGIILAVIVVLCKFNYIDTLLIDAIQSWWPVFLTGIGIMILQLQLARFCFLQEKGKFLALDNRGCFFIFTYFMFFYNTFLGLFSCLLRIAKGIVFGILLICRLDSSPFPKRFEEFDPGFKAYVGYMQVEYSHTHPVLIVFIRLLMLNKNGPVQPKSEKYTPIQMEEFSDIPLKPEQNNDGDDLTERRRKGARFNWHVAYTLLFNPELRVMRKGYLALLKQAQSLGVHIPISDTQANIDVETLSASVAEAKKKRSTKKNVEKDSN